VRPGADIMNHNCATTACNSLIITSLVVCLSEHNPVLGVEKLSSIKAALVADPVKDIS
jgi:hypothetical protein